MVQRELPPEGAPLRADVLALLLVAQQNLDVLPGEEELAAFLSRALEQVPGVGGAVLLLEGRRPAVATELEVACTKAGAEGVVHPGDALPGLPTSAAFPIRTLRRAYGLLALDLNDRGAFDPYLPVVSNVAGTVAATLETRELLRMTTAARAQLEELVATRTGELADRSDRLEKEMAEKDRVLAALAESEERLRLVAANAQDAIILIDEGGRVTMWNPAAERIFGRSRAEMIGQEVHELIAPPRSAEASRRGLAAFARYGIGPFVGRSVELAAVRPSGAEFPVEISVSPVRVRGQWHAIGIVRDVTARKRGEAARDALAAIVRSTTDAVIGKTKDGIVTSWNAGAERLYGHTAAEMTGRPLAVLAPPGRGNEITRLIGLVAAGQVVEDYETQRVHRDGRVLDVSLTLAPIHDDGGVVVGVSTIARDVTRRKEAERALRRTNRSLRTLSSCNQTLVRATSEAELLDGMCAILVEEGGFPRAWVGLVAEEAPGLVPAACRIGAPGAASRDASAAAAPGSPEQKVVSLAMSEREPRVHLGTALGQADPDRGGGPRGPAEIAAVPLLQEDRLLGVLVLHGDEPGTFDEEELRLVAELASDLAFGIEALRARSERKVAALERQHYLVQIRHNLEETVATIAATVEARDPYTAGHQRRVAAFAAAIAREIGLDEEAVQGIHLAGTIHDLGKIKVPAEILARPGQLSEIEERIIQIHPEAGWEILKGVVFPWPIAEMVLQHHERLDGSGYPRGLRGEQISLGARILGVADVVEAMASHRPYRPSRGLPTALAQIESDRAVCFDPAVVDACLALCREKGYRLGE